jgi:phosphoglycerol transferase MdoB-like AlkP superfamily enzyme
MKNSTRSLQFRYYLPAFVTGITVLIISMVTRLLLLFKSAHGVDWSVINLSGIIGIGLVYDIAIAAYFMIPIILHLWWTNEKMYEGKWKWITTLIFLAAISILLFTSLVPADFNKELRRGVIIYSIIRFMIFGFLAWRGNGKRLSWRKGVLLVDYFLIVYILLFIGFSEWFFWDEFSTRFNFIAVDYLVYTNEVLGNIQESYPVVWIILLVLALAFLSTFLNRKKLTLPPDSRPVFFTRTLTAIVLLIIPAVGYFSLNSNLRKFSSNEYVNELSGNGLFEFGTAFRHNELDFYKFYQTMPDSAAFKILRTQLESPNSTFTSNDIFNIERQITYNEPEKRMNVVLISVESLSADFMKAFGNKENITPHLDSLAGEGLFFTNLYSSGTRTVRGLEALALSITPTPGQSIVKRPDNENMFSLGSVFRSKGYESEYIYGGYGYFDNMNYFFSNNGYKVVDREAIPKQNIHYANIWGVADEDLFTLAINEFDSNYHKGKNFFAQVMTVSNHRPFTYPEGRIDIPPSKQVRAGAVKYTDYAIDKFLKDARQKPWFSNTIFLIVADHCAGSAGSAELPVTGYHIPLIIYSPGNIKPAIINRLTAQIDIVPTILGLLKFNYKSKFFGQDILSLPPGRERAFISTYQGLGYLKNNKLIIQSPVKKIQEWQPDFVTGKAVKTAPTDSLVNQAISFYQCASWLVNHKKYSK